MGVLIIKAIISSFQVGLTPQSASLTDQLSTLFAFILLIFGVFSPVLTFTVAFVTVKINSRNNTKRIDLMEGALSNSIKDLRKDISTSIKSLEVKQDKYNNLQERTLRTEESTKSSHHRHDDQTKICETRTERMQLSIDKVGDKVDTLTNLLIEKLIH